MKLLRVVILLICCLATGCATIGDHYRMKAYTETMDSYETAMRTSDFNVLCQYVDKMTMDREACMARYENMKIASYDVRSVSVAPDNKSVDLVVEASYFFLDRYVLKKKQYEQKWHYVEESERWFLETGPPDFSR